MLIKILTGAYGHRPDSDKTYIEKKDRSSGPFEVSDREAARLIGLGIAEKAEDDNSRNGVRQEYNLEQLSIQELRKMVKKLGLPADGSKEVLANKIRTASSSDEKMNMDDTEEKEPPAEKLPPDEAPPLLQAAEPEV